jgi:spermidine/putrescine ABC transporter ATP-binding subunit
MQRHRGQTVPSAARLGQPVQTFCPPWTPSLYVLYVPAMDNGGRPDVVLRGVTKRFGELVAVDNVDLEVQPGEFLALLGPSGCGKTTTLRMIAGFDEPTEGEIEIDGRPTVGIPPNKRNVNTVFQAYALFPHMTVLDNVAYGLKQRKVGKEERYREAGEALELVRLTGRERAHPAELSGGMQQRVALARALVMKPKVLLLDEPLGALDQKLRKAMQVELKRIQRDVGITFVVVTHDQEEAMAMADRIAVMHAGRIDQLAAPSEVYDRPATPFVADFIGDMNHLEGTLEREDGNLSAVVGGARFGIGRVVREAQPGERVRIGVRPEEVRASARGDGAAATVQTAMVLGHHVQVVAALESGEQIVALQRRAGDEEHERFEPGASVRLGWSPSSAMLLGPADGAAETAARDPLEVQA